jgi:hypothetical protein
VASPARGICLFLLITRKAGSTSYHASFKAKTYFAGTMKLMFFARLQPQAVIMLSRAYYLIFSVPLWYDTDEIHDHDTTTRNTTIAQLQRHYVGKLPSAAVRPANRCSHDGRP